MCFSGSGVGALVLPPLVRLALNHCGLDGTFVIMAGVSFNLCVCGMLFRPVAFYRQRYRRKRTQKLGAECNNGCSRQDRVTVSVINTDVPETTEIALRSSKIIATTKTFRETKKCVFDWKLLRNPLLYLYVVSLSVAASSFSNIFNILPQHTQQLGVSKTDSVWIVSILGFGDLGSRVCIGGFADLNIFRKRHILQVCVPGIRAWPFTVGHLCVCSYGKCGDCLFFARVCVAQYGNCVHILFYISHSLS